MKSRNEVMHAVRGIAILLVVAVHSVARFPECSVANVIKAVIYSFALPLFFFISGFFGKRILTCTWSTYLGNLARQFRRLMVPYVFFSLLVIPAKLALNSFADRPLALESAAKIVLLYPHKNPMIVLWFLYVIFLVQVGFLTLSSIRRPQLGRLGETVLTCLVLMVLSAWCRNSHVALAGLTQVGYYSLYYYLGAVVGHHHKAVQATIERFRYCLVALCVLWPFYVQIRHVWGIETVYTLCGIAWGFAVAVIVVKDTPRVYALLKPVADNAMSVYLLSYFFQVVVQVVGMDMLGVWPPIAAALLLIGGTVGPIVLAETVVSRSRILRLLVLGQWDTSRAPMVLAPPVEFSPARSADAHLRRNEHVGV